jgi:hypothetical protein
VYDLPSSTPGLLLPLAPRIPDALKDHSKKILPTLQLAVVLNDHPLPQSLQHHCCRADPIAHTLGYLLKGTTMQQVSSTTTTYGNNHENFSTIVFMVVRGRRRMEDITRLTQHLLKTSYHLSLALALTTPP